MCMFFLKFFGENVILTKYFLSNKYLKNLNFQILFQSLFIDLPFLENQDLKIFSQVSEFLIFILSILMLTIPFWIILKLLNLEI